MHVRILSNAKCIQTLVTACNFNQSVYHQVIDSVCFLLINVHVFHVRGIYCVYNVYLNSVMMPCIDPVICQSLHSL